jgi:predicted dehydrogenase
MLTPKAKCMDVASHQAASLELDSRAIAIVGAGGIVRDAHLPAYRKAGFHISGIYDIDSAKAVRLAGEYAIPVVYRSMTDVSASKKCGL